MKDVWNESKNESSQIKSQFTFFSASLAMFCASNNLHSRNSFQSFFGFPIVMKFKYMKDTHTYTHEMPAHLKSRIFLVQCSRRSFLFGRCVYSFCSLFCLCNTSQCKHSSLCLCVLVCKLLYLYPKKNWYSNGRICINSKWIEFLFLFLVEIYTDQMCVWYVSRLFCTHSPSRAIFFRVCVCKLLAALLRTITAIFWQQQQQCRWTAILTRLNLCTLYSVHETEFYTFFKTENE